MPFYFSTFICIDSDNAGLDVNENFISNAIGNVKNVEKGCMCGDGNTFLPMYSLVEFVLFEIKDMGGGLVRVSKPSTVKDRGEAGCYSARSLAYGRNEEAAHGAAPTMGRSRPAIQQNRMP